jgi:hypothetical protein
MNVLVKGIIAWCLAYLAVLVCFVIVASLMATSQKDASAFGSSDLLGNLTLLSKLAAAAIPSAILGKISGRSGIIAATILTLAVFILAQALPGGFLIFSIFTGEPPAMAVLYLVIAALAAAVMARGSGRSPGGAAGSSGT